MTPTQENYRNDLIRTVLSLPASRTKFTKSQLAYASVREAIVTHALAGDTPLDENYLHSLFPVGRTPLREALKRLSHEGLLVWSPHQAPTVRDVSMYEMRYLYETRLMIEPSIARLAARRATADDHQNIENQRLALERASKFDDIYMAVEMDYSLHAAIAKATQNRFLAESSNFLNLRSLRLWYQNQATHGIDSIIGAHAEIVDAIMERNEQRSEETAKKHIINSFHRYNTIVKEFTVKS